MGKRDAVVVLSSDEEEEDWKPNKNSRSKLSSSVPQAHRKVAKKKKARLSCSVPRSRSSRVDQIEHLGDEFDEALRAFNGSIGFVKNQRKELWVDKYKPQSLEELAVHKKKVEEVKMWFEQRLRTPKEEFDSYVLVISGPAGVGKSATVHMISSHLGAGLCEWKTPIPTLWQEHVHNSSSGIRYTSKLDEFENFIERTRKYISLSGDSKSSIILLIDDLPVSNGKFAYGRLQNCLRVLVQSTRTPTAILVTEYGNTESADSTARSTEELVLSLESAGACKVVFNPVTLNSIKKMLSRICRLEQCNATAEEIDLIAKASGGDIRHAITSLQYYSLKPETSFSSPSSNGALACFEEKTVNLNSLDVGVSLPFGRDETLSLFHALGKFLHNKRDTENAVTSDHDTFLLRERFRRLPLKMEAPEKVLSQAHGQARPVVDFLHENVLDFIRDENIDNAWTVASYLSEADFLLASSRGAITRSYEAESVLQSTAVSVAVRGVLFGNSNPLSSRFCFYSCDMLIILSKSEVSSPKFLGCRWHAIRRPKIWQVEQSSVCNKYEMMKQRFTAYDGLSSSNLSDVAMEHRHMLKWLGSRPYSGHVLTQGNDTEGNKLDCMTSDGQPCEASDDEIEDW